MKRKFRRYLSFLLSAAILTSSINVPVAAAPQLQTEIRLPDPAESKMSQGAQMQNNPEQNDLMQSDELQNETNVQVETIFPGQLRTGEVYHTRIEYSGGEEIAYIKASLNGDDLAVGEENQITFSLTEEGRNVLNLKFFDQDGQYLEKVYFIEGVKEKVQEEAEQEVKQGVQEETKQEEKTEELSEAAGGNLENQPENSIETELADRDSTEKITSKEEHETQPASEKGISTRKSRAAAKAAFSAVATITSPSVAAVITKPTDIKGTVSGTGITHYTLEYAIANDAFDVSKKEEEKQYFEFARGENLITGGVLGTLDTTALVNGFYNIRLTVYGENEADKKVSEISVSVEGAIKYGNFSTEFLDMDIPVHHFPLTVKRGYDSRKKQVSGDFGYGWSLTMNSASLTESGIPGKGWRTVKSGGFLPTYTLTEDYKHEVAIDWGNGKIEKFSMRPSPARQQITDIQYITSISYQAQGKSKSVLTPIGESRDFILNYGNILSYSGEYYAPSKYQLTKQDGTIYIFDKANGIEEIRDKAGNKITFKKDGVTHSDGKTIVFERDNAGRITRITGPTGKSQTYTYDGRGDLVSVTDTAGRVTEFQYDGEHYLIEIIDPRGVHVSRNEYDENGKLTAMVDANGGRVELQHDLNARIETLTDRLGNTTAYESDQRGNIVKITDALGNVIRNTYDAYDNLTETTDALGNKTTYTIGDDGKILSVKNALGMEMKNAYDTKGQLASVSAFGNQTGTISYNAYGQLTQTKDPMGYVKNYNYESDGKLSGITDDIGTYLTFTYDGAGNVLTAVNGNGSISSFTYDEDGNCLSRAITKTKEDGTVETITENYEYDTLNQVTKIIYSDGTFTSLEYNPIGDIAASVDANGRRTSYEYDIFGKLTKITYFDNTFELFEYDREHRNTKATNRLGQTFAMDYDSVGNLISKTYPNGLKEEYVYDAKYRLTAVTDVLGGTTVYTYDVIDRNTAATDALGNKTEYSYNAMSQMISIKDPMGNVTGFEYDKNGNRKKVVLADGNYLTAEYDARNRMVKQTDENAYSTEYQYDKTDRLTGITDAANGHWKYTYDEAGGLTAVTDPKNQKTRYEYDSLGRIIRTTRADGASASNTYDTKGNMASRTDYAGNQTVYEYDEHGRMTKSTSQGCVKEYHYNSDFLLATVKMNGSSTTYTYDSLKRLESKLQPDGVKIEYSYDDAGRLTSVKTPYGTTAYAYDILSRLTGVTDKDGRKTTYTYDANGNRTSMTYPNGLVTTYTYNQSNRLTAEKVVGKNNRTVIEYIYTLGKAGERTLLTETGGRTTAYQYDSLYRLTKETVNQNGSTRETAYAYDELSNRISKTENGVKTAYTYNNLNQLLQENDILYTYDENGNQTDRTDGNDQTVFTYDNSGKLTRVVIQNGTGTTTETYAYDWQGNRILKKTGSEEIHYIHDTNNWISHVIAETDASGQLIAHYTRGDDMLISQERNGTETYYIYDGHGSVRMLADENNDITDRYDYDAFGVLTAKTGTTVNPYLYAGEQYDQTTQLYYLRARYMDPAGGRFVTMDRYAGSIFDPVSLHKYLYGNGNPVMYRDPTGQWSLPNVIGSMGIIGALNAIPTSNLLTGLGIFLTGVLLTQVVITPRDMMEGYFVNPFPANVGQGILNGNNAIWEVFENNSLNTAGQILGRVLEVFGSDVDSQAVFEVRGEGNFDTGQKKNPTKSESKVWKDLDNVKGQDRKTSGIGKNKQYYEWDHTHNDIEVYDRKGNHLGSMEPTTGEIYKPAVPGRTIKIN